MWFQDSAPKCTKLKDGPQMTAKKLGEVSCGVLQTSNSKQVLMVMKLDSDPTRVLDLSGSPDDWIDRGWKMCKKCVTTAMSIVIVGPFF